MKVLLFIVFIILFSRNNAQNETLNYYAISSCENQSIQDLKDMCNENKITIITELKGENVLFIQSNSTSILDIFCFFSKVKIKNNQLAFNTNTIIIKSKTDKLDIKGYKLTKSTEIPTIFYLKYLEKNENELIKLKDELKTRNDILHSSINQVFTLNKTSSDPLYNRQWSIKNTGSNLQGNGLINADMNVDSAWNITQGSNTIAIAIMDSGVDTLHEDLNGNLLPGKDCFATINSNTYGYPSLDFSDEAHGTSCAGIVSAIKDNNLGIAGIAPNCKIIPIRLFHHQDYGSSIGIRPTSNTTALLEGTAFAWRNANADIISASIGLAPIYINYLNIDTSLINNEIKEAYQNARNGKGIAMFFSTGNDNSTDVLWPANLRETIGVGASTMCDERKSYNDCSNENFWGSNYSDYLDIIAPGVAISTLDISGQYGYTNNNYTNQFNGTSASCPNAAGVGALMLSVNPTLNAENIRYIINKTADKVSNYNYDSLNTTYGYWNNEVGYGRINAFKAVKKASEYFSSIHNPSISQFKTFPNPAINNISVSSTLLNITTIKIYNTLGKVVLSKKYNNKTKETEIDISNLSKGYYIIEVMSDNNSHTSKLIIK